MIPGVRAGGFVNTYQAQAPPNVRAALALLRDYTKVAGLPEVAPVVLELGYLTASALATAHRYDRDRVDSWLAARTRTAEQTGTGEEIGDRADLAAVAVASIAAEALWVPDRDALYERHATRAARHLWAATRRARDQAESQRLRYELVLSAAWLTAYALSPTLANNG